MDFLKHFFSTNTLQDDDNYGTDQNDIDTEIAQEHDFKSKELECERYILDEQDREGRLLPLVSKALRNIYGSKTVTRCLRRLYMRRHRDNCSNKAKYEQIKKLGQAFFGKDKEKSKDDKPNGISNGIFANDNTL